MDNTQIDSSYIDQRTGRSEVSVLQTRMSKNDLMKHAKNLQGVEVITISDITPKRNY